MRVRILLTAGGLTLALAIYYVASPLLAAHKLQEAVKSGDTRTIEVMVNWPTLRASVKETVARNSQLLPVATGVARSVTPTLWQRVRSVFGHSMLDRFIERYITPAGLPELYRAKNAWHEKRSIPEPKSEVVQASIIPEKFTSAWRRIKRAEFVNPLRFVLELEDRHNPSRLIESTFQLSSVSLSGFHWQLSSISIRSIDTAKANLAALNGFNRAAANRSPARHSPRETR